MGLQPTKGDVKTLNGKTGWQAKTKSLPHLCVPTWGRRFRLSTPTSSTE